MHTVRETSKTPGADVQAGKCCLSFCDHNHPTIGLPNLTNYSVQQILYSSIFLDSAKYLHIHNLRENRNV